MPFDCEYRARFGQEACLVGCPATVPGGAFDYVRVATAADAPAPRDTAVDVAILDMNHGWPNLGHDAIVHAVQNLACDLRDDLQRAGLVIRAVSYDVRRGHVLPPAPNGRCSVYVGTGGPGHIDPRRNDGVSDASQGIREDPAWEPRLFALFDAIHGSEGSALLAVCHTFGVMCRWLGVATPTLRGPAQGGKSTGIKENVLSDAALAHPWFRRFSAELPEGRRLRILDNRLFDLIPDEPPPRPVLAVGHESGPGASSPPALTMMEVARDAAGVMPRILAVNHHPEIVNRSRQLTVLRAKRERGEVSREWLEERVRTLTQTIPDENTDQRLHVTASYTFLAPLRFHVYRAVRERAEELGRTVVVHEDHRPLVFNREPFVRSGSAPDAS